MRPVPRRAQVETRVVSGQMSNMATFSALMDWKNRLDRKHTPQRLGYVMNNHIIKGGHLSAQPWARCATTLPSIRRRSARPS